MFEPIRLWTKGPVMAMGGVSESGNPETSFCLQNQASRAVSGGVRLMDRQVVVIGAGLAGLMAATELNAQGFVVRVLEARHRVGGRVHTCYRQGLAIEAGGEFIDSMRAHSIMHRTVQKLGLGLTPTALPALSQHWGSQCLSAEEIGQRFGPQAQRDLMHVWASAQALGAMVDIQDPLASPVARSLDQLSVAQWRQLLDVHPVVGTLLDRHIRLEYGEAEKTSLLYFALMNKLYDNIADDELECFRIAGGNQKLPEALASQLGDSLVLQTQVYRASLSQSRWTIETNAGQFSADFLIVAAPLGCVREIEFSPPLSPVLQSACDSINYADHFKMVLDYPVPSVSESLNVPEYVQTDASIQWTWSAPLAQPEQLSASGLSLICYGLESGSDQALLHEPQAQINQASREIDALSAGSLKTCHQTSAHFWGRDPLSHGSYSQYGPGQMSRYWHVLRQPHDRLVFAGEHTANFYVGYMEGALESGLRAARQVAALAEPAAEQENPFQILPSHF